MIYILGDEKMLMALAVRINAAINMGVVLVGQEKEEDAPWPGCPEYIDKPVEENPYIGHVKRSNHEPKRYFSDRGGRNK